MRVLLVHNRYKQRGGEDMVFAAEAALLRRFGHEVIEFIKDNKDLESYSRMRLLRDTVWSRQSYRELTSLITKTRPNLVHFHNTLPLVSPAAIRAAKSMRVATVQTLHNYRLVCPSGQLFRNGRPCEDCVGRKLAWPGVLHACYRGSRPATAAVAAMIATHRLLRTWSEQVDRYIALTEFSRQRLVEGCLPADRIAVKPNFLSPDPGEGTGSGGFVLFVGRLSPEKGVRTLLSTWRQMRPTLPLKIVGSGPLDKSVAAAVAQVPSIEWLGDQPHGDVLQLMGDAAVLVAPAEWYEPFGLTIIEAFAKGTPVIGADIGSIGGLVANGQNGYLHRAGDPGDLATKLQAFFDDPAAIPAMRRAARRTYETGYTAEQNYERLMKIYADAIEQSSMSSVGGANRNDNVGSAKRDSIRRNRSI